MNLSFYSILLLLCPLTIIIGSNNFPNFQKHPHSFNFSSVKFKAEILCYPLHWKQKQRVVNFGLIDYSSICCLNDYWGLGWVIIAHLFQIGFVHYVTMSLSFSLSSKLTSWTVLIMYIYYHHRPVTVKCHEFINFEYEWYQRRKCHLQMNALYSIMPSLSIILFQVQEDGCIYIYFMPNFYF